ncbi:tyrosine protein phosphatase [Virgibacillus phasianinus]|uniref:Tyrosine-protein phosphatase n=1 Tax=Virgibacillus phasianinus TaxID=2017483 RepID=A0A220U2H7_9BACI|nr:CpsB/CapC family capsule biosynthesis tyrosine phosphatase [Virgibacillus phasianinus]ASK62277.1 tyrosine protein phosphatase [Virgibacillus phasianinus]
MIDINCHILPGMDEGAKSLTESLKMADIAVQQGITHIIATPHHTEGDAATSADNIIGAVDYLNGKLKEQDVPLKILPGQEPRVYGEMLKGLRSGEVLPLNQTSEYVFINLPRDYVPHYLTQLQFDLQIAEYKPIIVHPERNQELIANPDKLYRMVKNGALTQITAASIVGKSGKKIQKFAHQMIQANLGHFIASEANNGHKKSFYLKQAYGTIKNGFGNAMVYQFMENSQYIVDNLTVPKEQPERIRIKKGLRIFS